MKNEVRPIGAEPLTMEQLRWMDKPVWCSCKPLEGGDGYWCLCQKGNIITPGGSVYNVKDIPHWVFYAYHPAHIDREAWEKPCGMCGGKTTLYQHTNTTKLFMNTFGEAATLVTECMACPPYADCCMKGISANSAFKINFCPECGRPLTEKAWAEMERRLGDRPNG